MLVDNNVHCNDAICYNILENVTRLMFLVKSASVKVSPLVMLYPGDYIYMFFLKFSLVVRLYNLVILRKIVKRSWSIYMYRYIYHGQTTGTLNSK